MSANASQLTEVSSSVTASSSSHPHRSKPTFQDGRYGNPWDTFEKRTLIDVIKWKATETNRSNVPNQDKLDKTIPVLKMNSDIINNPPADQIQATWLGHSSILVQMGGFNFLTDPVFGERASPIPFAGPKRYRPTPCKVNELPKIDFVVISHNHYDHLDYTAITSLGSGPVYIVPIGLGRTLRSFGATKVVELNWWNKHDLTGSQGEKIEVTCVPCQHWSKRSIGDDNCSLWAGYVVRSSNRKFYFAGDTAYCPCFLEIGDEFAPIDLAAIPIGAYEPRSFMKPQHLNPEEAVKIHKEIGAKKSLGIHWGTFVLTDEFYLEPVQKLDEALEQYSVEKSAFQVTKIGETFSV